jgi:hypothetical protein
VCLLPLLLTFYKHLVLVLVPYAAQHPKQPQACGFALNPMHMVQIRTGKIGSAQAKPYSTSHHQIGQKCALSL